MKAENTLERARGMSYKGLALNLLLTVFKLLAGIFGNSTALLADSVRSFQDFMTEFLRILNFHISGKPEDSTHNYGHGKVATLLTGAGTVVLLFAGIQMLSIGAGELITLIDGEKPDAPCMITLLVAAISFISKGTLFHFGGKKSIRFSENGNSADSPRFCKEIFLSGCVLLGIGCTFLPGDGWIAADALAAALISLLILKNSGLLLYGTANELVEASLDEESNRNILKIINETEGVISCQGLKTRKIGNDIAINASISVKDSLNIGEAARISSRVEERLKAAYGEETYTLIKAEPGSGRSCPLRKWDKLPEERAGKNLILEN